jgi:hypothetical protein
MPKGRAQSNQRTEPTPCRRGGIPREFAPFKMEPANLSQGLDAMTAGTARRKELTHRERPAPFLRIRIVFRPTKDQISSMYRALEFREQREDGRAQPAQ